jgi:hypothetical protein
MNQNQQSAAAQGNAPAPDLSALAGMLSGALGQNQSQQQAAPDLSGLAGMLGGAMNQNQQSAAAQGNAPAPDLSALAGMLGGALGQNQSQQQAAPDLSGLAGILGNALGQAQPNTQAGNADNGFDVSTLTNMLGGPPQGGGGGGAPAIDMNMILRLSQAMSSMQSNRQNVDFLLALKPRLNDTRAKKVDDAIRVMQIIQFLPLLKESGIFEGLDQFLGNITGGSGGITGGLGNLLSGSGGLGGILNSLLGR